MTQAWRRYENERDSLHVLLYLLGRELQRGEIDREWIKQEINDIAAFLDWESHE